MGTDGAKDVVLDSADLRYLAEQIDVLDKTIQGLTLQRNASIQYVYHTHTGSASSGTGCYTRPVYHNHSGACPSTQVAHTHYNVIWSTSLGYQDGNGNTFKRFEIICSDCGGNRFEVVGTNAIHYVPQYNCGYSDGQFLGYTLNCGKSTSTIDSAYIVFD